MTTQPPRLSRLLTFAEQQALTHEQYWSQPVASGPPPPVHGSYLLDANTLIALLDPQHVQHRAVRRWFRREAQPRGWATCPSSERVVLAVMSHPDYPGRLTLEEAAMDAQMLENITAHPEAFQRHLRDNGSDLSGGERQRLELCRALLRRPSILLLDEATSALDNATQSRVLDALQRRGITVISVAHRLDAALRSDQVLVMQNGAVIEQGSPQLLLAAGGAFHALVQAESPSQVVLL